MEKNFLEPDAFLPSNIADINGPVTFLLYELGCYFFN